MNVGSSHRPASDAEVDRQLQQLQELQTALSDLVTVVLVLALNASADPTVAAAAPLPPPDLLEPILAAWTTRAAPLTVLGPTTLADPVFAAIVAQS